MNLTIRKTAANSENDFVVVDDEKIMARMYERQDTHKRTVWYWTLIGAAPHMPWMRGTVNTVAEAKVATKTAIERFAAVPS